jgi:lipopolysaccharide transport system permease protein
MLKLLGQIAERRELLAILVSRNLKIRYKSSVLGFFWTLLGPLCMIAIYGVFAALLKFSNMRLHYLEYLITGLIAWQFLLMCLGDSLHAIMGNANLVKKTSFPRIVLPLSMVTANLINFFLTLAVLTCYLLFASTSFGPLYLFPLVLLTHVALCLGMSLLLSTSNVFFRDTEHLLGIVTLAWFFMSPIMYPISMQLQHMPENLQWLPFLNPLSGILSVYRSIFIDDPSVPMAYLAISFAMCWVILFIGIAVFQKVQVRFGDEL